MPCRLLGRGGLDDPGDVLEELEVREGAGGGVQALPQHRERLDGAGDVRVDPEADQQAGDLLGVVQAVAGGGLVRGPAGAVLGCRWGACVAEALLDRDLGAPRDGDPVARLDGGLIAGRGGADGLALGLQEAPAGAREILAGWGGGEVVGDRAGDAVLVLGHGVVDRDRIGLRVQRQALVVGDRGHEACPAVLDRRDLRGVRGDRVGDELAVDDTDVRAVTRDDQAVGLQRGDVDEVRERRDTAIAGVGAARPRGGRGAHAGAGSTSSSSCQSMRSSTTSSSTRATGTLDSSTPPRCDFPWRPARVNCLGPSVQRTIAAR